MRFCSMCGFECESDRVAPGNDAGWAVPVRISLCLVENEIQFQNGESSFTTKDAKKAIPLLFATPPAPKASAPKPLLLRETAAANWMAAQKSRGEHQEVLA